MPVVTWDHIHLRTPDPEAMAAWLHDILGGEIVRGPGRIDVKLGGANIFIAPVTAGDGVNAPPATPYQGLDHIGLKVVDIDATVAELRHRIGSVVGSRAGARPEAGPGGGAGSFDPYTTSTTAELAVAEVKGLVTCTGPRSSQGGC